MQRGVVIIISIQFLRQHYLDQVYGLDYSSQPRDNSWQHPVGNDINPQNICYVHEKFIGITLRFLDFGANPFTNNHGFSKEKALISFSI